MRLAHLDLAFEILNKALETKKVNGIILPFRPRSYLPLLLSFRLM
ncbi:conserved hypothetical protein [Listeria ivanovii FSL F6-596]|nr:conserved hypothetical protein [Listeria ivanovii FSL F6-596]